MKRAYTISDQSKIYFVTFTVVKWIKVFEVDRFCEVFLNSVRYCQTNKGLEVYSWCIMPNHVHMIIGSKGEIKLEDIIRDLKSFTSRSIHLMLDKESDFDLNAGEWLNLFIQTGIKKSNNKNFQFWKSHYHAVLLSTNYMMDQRLNYIHNNPVKAGLVDVPDKWKWSSAIDYYGGKGLIDIIFIE